MKRRLVWGVSCAAIVAALLLFIIANRDEARARPRDGAVSAPVLPLPESSPEAPSSTLEVPGVLFARETVDIAGKIEGRIESIRFRLGEAVPRDALIATLDSQIQRRELSIAEATLRASRAEEE